MSWSLTDCGCGAMLRDEHGHSIEVNSEWRPRATPPFNFDHDRPTLVRVVAVRAPGGRAFVEWECVDCPRWPGTHYGASPAESFVDEHEEEVPR